MVSWRQGCHGRAAAGATEVGRESTSMASKDKPPREVKKPKKPKG
jgi:hypothetical protein